MKRILRHYVIDTFSLWAVSQITSGLVFERGVVTLLIAGIGVTIVSIAAKPVINLLLFPLNLVTFGVFRWVSSAIIIFLVTLIVPAFKVNGFYLAAISNNWMDIPAINLSGAFAFIGFSFFLSFITSFIYWLIK